eukprot:4573651-Prymnesium_polylepis.1
MSCGCSPKPLISSVRQRQMDNSFAQDDSAYVPQADQGFAVHHICVHTCYAILQKEYQREAWNVGFELSPRSGLSPRQMYPDAQTSRMHDTCARMRRAMCPV